MINESGQIWLQRFGPSRHDDDDTRTPFERDYARIIHSASFRRLQGKTQILNVGEGDFYRTRLTHTLEVAQIAGGLVRQFERKGRFPEILGLLDATLVQALGLAHDLGHPPFGHGGEVALNYCMRNAGGFEGNGQSLRILTRLEKMSENCGANLTRRALLGVLKYPVPYSQAIAKRDDSPRLRNDLSTLHVIDREACEPPKCYMDSEQDIVEWVLEPLSDTDRNLFQMTNDKGKPQHKSFDCSIMDVADDIAYGIHDLEDAISLKLIDEADFRARITPELAQDFLISTGAEIADFDKMVRALFGDSRDRKAVIGQLVHHMITRAEIITLAQFDEPLLRYRARLDGPPALLLDQLKKLVLDLVIKSPTVQQLEFKGQKMVVDLFEVLASEPKRFLPADTYKKLKDADDPESKRNDLRVICDYVAGMTDQYLMRTFERFFSPRMGSVFDRM